MNKKNFLKNKFNSEFQYEMFSFQVDYENNLQHDSADFKNDIYNKPLDYARKKVKKDYLTFTEESKEFFINEIIQKGNNFFNRFNKNFDNSLETLDIINQINCAYEKTITEGNKNKDSLEGALFKLYFPLI